MTADLTALSSRVGAALAERGATVAAAESCTGGLLLSALTVIGTFFSDLLLAAVDPRVRFF